MHIIIQVSNFNALEFIFKLFIALKPFKNQYFQQKHCTKLEFCAINIKTYLNIKISTNIFWYSWIFSIFYYLKVESRQNFFEKFLQSRKVVKVEAVFYFFISIKSLGSTSGKAATTASGSFGSVEKSLVAFISCTSLIPYIFFALKQ